MDRITRKNVEGMFETLCKVMGKRIATDYNDVGAWRLDYIACYGGWVIEEVCNEAGGIRHPIVDNRKGNRDMWEAMRFALRTLEAMGSVPDNRL
jgi:hypothetical protein